MCRVRELNIKQGSWEESQSLQGPDGGVSKCPKGAVRTISKGRMEISDCSSGADYNCVFSTPYSYVNLFFWNNGVYMCSNFGFK